MKAALVRLLLLAPLLFSGSIHALNDAESELFLISTVGQHHQGPTTTLCRSLNLCHNSKGFAYSSVQVFSALEGLLNQLQLSPANDYVQLTQLNGCVNEQCCCSTPIQINLSLPLHGKDAAAEADRLLQQTRHYLEQQLPHAIDGLVCVGQLEECAADTSSSSSSSNSRSGRQLLSELASPSKLLSVQPVPQLPAGLEPYSGRRTAVLEVADYYAGSYGQDSSSGYGSYGAYTAAAAAAAAIDESAGSAGRSLLAVPEKQQAAMKAAPAAAKPAAPKQEQSNGSNPVGKNSTVTASAAAAACVPCPSCSNAPGSKGQQQQQLDASSSKAGSCYCRYVAQTASWALEESACKAALYARCGQNGSLLECKHLEAYYSALGKSRLSPTEAPHVDAISAFLYVDCTPAPPCSCKALTLAAKETKAQRQQCCADLKAWCQVPFSGIDCNEAVSFCSSKSSLAEDTVYGFSLVKTHGIDCKDAQFAAAYTSTVVDMPAAFEEVEAMFLEQQRLAMRQRRMAAGVTIAVTLVASCVALGVAAFGVLVIIKHYAIRRVAAPMDVHSGWHVY